MRVGVEKTRTLELESGVRFGECKTTESELKTETLEMESRNGKNLNIGTKAWSRSRFCLDVLDNGWDDDQC